MDKNKWQITELWILNERKDNATCINRKQDGENIQSVGTHQVAVVQLKAGLQDWNGAKKSLGKRFKRHNKQTSQDEMKCPRQN